MADTTQNTAVALRYSSVAIVLHWAIAAAILFQLAGGTWMVDFAGENSALRFSMYQIHKTVGLLILALTLARLCWRLGHHAPAPQSNWTPLERAASHAVHVAFYVVMIAAPLSGWAMASASPTNIPTFFFLQQWLPFAHLPGFAGLDPADRGSVEDLLKQLHALLGYVMTGLLLLHVGAALKHQFIDRDRILDRMRFGRRSAAPSAGAAGFGIAAVVLPVALMGRWLVFGLNWRTVPQSKRRQHRYKRHQAIGRSCQKKALLALLATYNGAEVTGRFANWTSSITFDPQKLDIASAKVEIDMASYTISDAYLQAQAEGSDGFSLASFPTANFESTAFREDASGFIMDGVLTLRGIAVPLSIPFSFERDENTARVSRFKPRSTGQHLASARAGPRMKAGSKKSFWCGSICARKRLISVRGHLCQKRDFEVSHRAAIRDRALPE